mmetsp:Transcript_91713/g.163233  ORF Transcript_91713/g.163233 Transcript_91713/m.163233 type:complete len:85 (+) Transcript_91713:377-631(+)
MSSRVPNTQRTTPTAANDTLCFKICADSCNHRWAFAEANANQLLRIPYPYLSICGSTHCSVKLEIDAETADRALVALQDGHNVH